MEIEIMLETFKTLNESIGEVSKWVQLVGGSFEFSGKINTSQWSWNI